MSESTLLFIEDGPMDILLEIRRRTLDIRRMNTPSLRCAFFGSFSRDKASCQNGLSGLSRSLTHVVGCECGYLTDWLQQSAIHYSHQGVSCRLQGDDRYCVFGPDDSTLMQKLSEPTASVGVIMQIPSGLLMIQTTRSSLSVVASDEAGSKAVDDRYSPFHEVVSLLCPAEVDPTPLSLFQFSTRCPWSSPTDRSQSHHPKIQLLSLGSPVIAAQLRTV